MCSPVLEEMWEENKMAGLTLRVLAWNAGYGSVSVRPDSSFQKGLLFLSELQNKSDERQPVGGLSDDSSG